MFAPLGVAEQMAESIGDADDASGDRHEIIPRTRDLVTKQSSTHGSHSFAII